MTAIELGFPPETSLGGGKLDPYCIHSPKLFPEEIGAFATSAAAIFKETGFVILKDALDKEEATKVHEVCKELHKAVQQRDEQGEGNRNPGRYSLGATVGPGQCLHLSAFTRHLVDNVFVLPVLDCIYDQKNAEGARYIVSGAGGDYCLGNTAHFQKIHSDKSAARPLAPHRGDSSKGPIHSRDVPPLISVNYVVQELTQWNGAMRIVTWKDMEDFGPERAAPDLEQELKEVPKWLSSKIFPLEAGDALIRDVRVWHGGCPNLSGEVRFLPSIEVMSREYFDWNVKGKGCKGRGKANSRHRHAQPLMPENLFTDLSDHARRHCSEIVARTQCDLVNKRIDDTEWLRDDVVKAPRDPYLLAAVKSLEDSDCQDMVKVLIELERYAKAGELSGTRYDLYKLINGWYNRYNKQIKENGYRNELRTAVERLLNLLVGTPDATPEENRASQRLVILLYGKLFPNNHGRWPLSPRSAPITSISAKHLSISSSACAAGSASGSTKLLSGSARTGATSRASGASRVPIGACRSSATSSASSASRIPSGSLRSCATSSASSAPEFPSVFTIQALLAHAESINNANDSSKLPSGSGGVCVTKSRGSLSSHGTKRQRSGEDPTASHEWQGDDDTVQRPGSSSASYYWQGRYGKGAARKDAAKEAGQDKGAANEEPADEETNEQQEDYEGGGPEFDTDAVLEEPADEEANEEQEDYEDGELEYDPDALLDGVFEEPEEEELQEGKTEHALSGATKENESGVILPYKRSREQENKAASRRPQHVSRSKDSIPIGASRLTYRASQPRHTKCSQPSGGKAAAIADGRVIGKAPTPKASSIVPSLTRARSNQIEMTPLLTPLPKPKARGKIAEVAPGAPDWKRFKSETYQAAPKKQ